MLGGAIGVASIPGEGSVFTFYVKTHRGVRPRQKDAPGSLLPASIRVSLDAVLFDTNTAFLEDGPTGKVELEKVNSILERPAEPSLSNIKILVVEDNLVNQRVLCQQLRKRGYFVEFANHGLDALNQLKQTTNWRNNGPRRKFDVILMDLEMPVMGGIECIQKIRQAEEEGVVSDRIPVIAVTANARSMHAEAALKAGMDGIMVKPYRIEDLLLQIESACSGKRA